MSSPYKQTVAASAADTGSNFTAVERIDSSTRGPLMFFFVSAVLWLIASSLFAVLSSIKMHAPGMLASVEWLTYGRVRPAAVDMFLYGFASQAAMAIGIWMLCRLGRVSLVAPGVLFVGGLFWNLAVLLGVGGILGGDSSGYELFEFPRYAAAILFFAYLIIGIVAVLTFAFRNQKHTYASQWFILAAFFIFPWLLSTAGLLLLASPVRGAAQTAISYWYANGFVMLWLTPLCLGTIFYLIPRASGQALNNHYLAAVSFWLFLLIAGWGGVPVGARLPAWMPSMSTAAKVLMLVPVVAMYINWRATWINSPAKERGGDKFKFISFAALVFVISAAVMAVASLPLVAQTVEYTLFTPAVAQLFTYGFIAMAIFGGMYFIVPRITDTDWLDRRIKTHFLLSLAGLIMILVAWGVGGVIQGNAQNQGGEFMKSVSAVVPFIGIGTLGFLVLLISHFLFLSNLISVMRRCCTALCGCGKETRK